ncbi:MAG: putative lipid II flippase FtsW [Mariprofundaceae bacterium]|nr:putative lipid II flippase FtsW [Mariprofundaceae bacterium]
MRPAFDSILIGCVIALLTLSILMVGSASLSVSEVRYNDAFRIIRHWLIYIPFGLLLMWGVSRVHPSWWKAACLPLLITSLLIMVAVLITGQSLNGATRWFSFFGLSLQPVELLKPAIILYMAYYMGTFPDRLHQLSSGLAPMLLILCSALVLLMLQPDFGNSVLIFIVCFILWFVGGIPFLHLAAMTSVLIPVGIIAVIAEPYRVERLLSFTDPWADQFGSGYQLIQSMIAFGSGGLTGSGLGQGIQKLFYLPEAFTDFIAAVMGEELGLIGTAGLIIIFGILIMRGLQLAMRCEQTFERLLATGCTLLIGISFFINLAAVMGMIPTKGMPIPFFSYGGSALFGNCILMGFLLGIHRHLPVKQNNSIHHTSVSEVIT